MPVSAHYYDGRTARRHEVTLTVENGVLYTQGTQDTRDDPLSSLQLPSALGKAPRLILFADGARCEIADHAAFAELFQTSASTSSIVAHMEARWGYAFGALVLTVMFFVAMYLWALPIVAAQLADKVPDSALQVMDEQFFETFDGHLLHPSKLSPARQQALTSRILALQQPPGAKRPSRILYRSSPEIGPNAFALPGGSIVILDEIVRLSDNDEEIMGVLAHEMGHVAERHVVRQILQSSAVGLVMAWYVGDVSNLLAAAPTLLLQTRYSREFERKADAYAATMLSNNGISPSRLADMLEKLQRAYDKNSKHKSDMMDYLSSHPATAERIKTLRGQR
jgi:Zn-dependent protease with chaperone function